MYDNDDTCGPSFRWFAYRPVWTQDRGLRWLRLVYRRRCVANHDAYAGSYFEHSVEPF